MSGSGQWAAETLGHRFTNPALLQEALHHSSLPGTSYERLEFLGDRVLGLIIAEWLLEEFPTEPEGALSRRHVGLVRREALVEIAQGLGLGAVLEMSSAEASGGGRDSANNLSDALEAVLAAVYLDAGYAAAQALVLRLWRPLLSAAPPVDAKTRLQEWAQAQGPQLPRYEEVSREGPSHAPHFVVKVTLPDGRMATGEGGSRRAAEQAAAAAVWSEVNHG